MDYLFLNPNTGKQEFKHSWAVRHDGLLFGSGWYQVLPNSPLDVTKADPAEYTVVQSLSPSFLGGNGHRLGEEGR